MKLVVGLGNPGAVYAATRHNLGFMVVDCIARRTRSAVKQREALSLVGCAQPDILLVKPQTFMNGSGDAVYLLIRRFGTDLSDLLVIYDDMDLPPGSLRLRKQGSAGSHNGMRSIISRLASDAFPRLRIGIGPPPPHLSGADFVLAPIESEAWPVLSAAVERAADAVLVWASQGIDRAMSRFNGMAPPGGGSD